MVKVTIAAATEAMIAMLLDETAEQCERSGVRTMQRDHIRDAVISSDGARRRLGQAFCAPLQATKQNKQ
jgi:hypothetical protein